MAEFSLPSNSKILKGDYYKDITGSKKLMFIDGILKIAKIQESTLSK